MYNTDADVRMPPPLPGEHSEEIYLDLLGYSREEYDTLAAQGLVGDRYPESVLPSQ
jgi:crotonobetainyl-CoA:carnitine CoA-transferase CaiB-like acyl-CoA transferase